MNENESETAMSGQNPAGKQPQPRVPRSIRFSDSEWACIEKEAKARGMTAAEFVRHAAVRLATGKVAANSVIFLPEVAAQIKRIFRGVDLLSMLKRDELIRDGSLEELDLAAEAASESQEAMRSEANNFAHARLVALLTVGTG